MAHRYDIQVIFGGGLTSTQQAVFETATEFWSRIITADVPSVRIGNTVINDIVIFAEGTRIDEGAGILGQAWPVHLRPVSLLPATGVMQFNTAYISRLESDGRLLNVIVHEIAHVLGFGTLWERLDLLRDAETSYPVFIGDNAMWAFAELTGAAEPTPVPIANSWSFAEWTGPAEPTPVPIANTGDPRTWEGHWRDSVFGNELMTGYLKPGANPVSRLSVASLEDLGYRIDYRAAAALFDLPGTLRRVMMGISAQGHNRYQCCCMCGHRGRGGRTVVLPEDAVVRPTQTTTLRKVA